MKSTNEPIANFIPPSSNVYGWRFNTRTYELSADNIVRLPVYLNYIEETAVQASSSYGYTFDWYMANNAIWVARKHTLRFYAAAQYPEELEMHTWISDIRRVQSHREYHLRRVSDGQLIMRGRTNWVYINFTTKRPERVPEIFSTAIVTGESTPIALDTDIIEPYNVENSSVFSVDRTADWLDIDSAKHVNNAVYVAWIENAIDGQLNMVGWTPSRFQDAGILIKPLSHEIEYLRSAVNGDSVHITTSLTAVGRDRAQWTSEISLVATGEVLVRDVCVRAFEAESGPRSIPDDLVLALCRR